MGKISLIAVIRILAIVGQIAFIKIYTHYLSPTELGLFFFYTTVSYFLNALLFVPIDYFQQAEVFNLERSGNSLYGIISLNLRLLSSIAFLSVVVSVGIAIFHIAFLSAFSVIIVSSIFLYVSTAAKNFLNNQGDQSFVVLMQVAEVPIKVLIFLWLVRQQVTGPLSPIIATTGALLIVALICYQRMHRYQSRFHGAAKHVGIRNVIQFCSPISIGAILNWLQLQGYRLVLVPLGYTADIGLFATVAGIGQTGMNAAGIVYRQIYEPRIYQTAGKYLRTYLKGAAAAILFVLIVGLGLRTQIIGLVTNKLFVAYAWVIGYGILTSAGNLLIGSLVIQLSIDDNTALQIKAHIYGLAVVPFLYLALHEMKCLNVFTMGIPLVISQIIVVAYSVFHFGVKAWKRQISSRTCNSITFVVFTYNEEKRIQRVIQNFLGFGKILIVDNYSDDSTVEIAKSFGCDILLNKNSGWVEDSETAAKVKAAVQTPWIYWAFADEMLDEQGILAILDAVESGKYSIVNIVRKNYYYGSFCHEAFAHRMNRIFKKEAIDFTGNTIHHFGTLTVGKKAICYLDAKRYYVRHFISNDAKSYLRPMDRYTDMEAAGTNRNYGRLGLCFKVFKTFVGNYLVRGAYKAGFPGLFLVINMMYYECLAMMKTYEYRNGLNVDQIESLNNIERDRLLKLASE